MSSEQRLEPTIARLQAMDWRNFEDFVGEFFEQEGWETEVTQDADDDGIDVIAERDGYIDERAVIQAKRHAPDNEVTYDDVARYSALLRDDHQTDMAVVVTTSYFTEKAYNYAREKNVKLMDGAAVAGFIIANDLGDLLKEYTPDDFELEDAPEEVFLADEAAREAYFGDRSTDFAARVFQEKDLLDALDTIDSTEVGGALVRSLDELREAIEDGQDEPPTEILRQNPRLLDVSWFDVGVSREVSGDINESENLSSPAGPPSNTDVVGFRTDDHLTMCAFLPINESISRCHLTYIEDCVDYVLRNGEYDSTQVDGLVLGNQVACSSAPGTKLPRLRRAGIEAMTYEDVLSSTVRAKKELLDAVRPFFKISQDEEMIEKLDRLNNFA